MSKDLGEGDRLGALGPASSSDFRKDYSSSPYWATFLRSSRQWISWGLWGRHSRIPVLNPGSSTMGIGSGEARCDRAHDDLGVQGDERGRGRPLPW